MVDETIELFYFPFKIFQGYRCFCALPLKARRVYPRRQNQDVPAERANTIAADTLD
jgi:hypothetical protein